MKKVESHVWNVSIPSDRVMALNEGGTMSIDAEMAVSIPSDRVMVLNEGYRPEDIDKPEKFQSPLITLK